MRRRERLERWVEAHEELAMCWLLTNLDKQSFQNTQPPHSKRTLLEPHTLSR